jgi:hypothetical protein
LSHGIGQFGDASDTLGHSQNLGFIHRQPGYEWTRNFLFFGELQILTVGLENLVAMVFDLRCHSLQYPVFGFRIQSGKNQGRSLGV